jgi:small nuclear ribonucleoprotein (snRNP)-like protein
MFPVSSSPSSPPSPISNPTTSTPEVREATAKKVEAEQIRKKTFSKQQDSIKNLGVLLRHFAGLELSIECKNGQVFRGILQEVDDYMNLVIQILKASFQSRRTNCDPLDFDMIHIRGSNIRYIHFPDNADLPKLVRLGLDRIKTAQNKYARGTRNTRASVT